MSRLAKKDSMAELWSSRRYVLYMQRKPHRPLLGQFQDSDAYCAMLDVLENDAGPVRVESTECHPGYAHTMAASEV
jgi:hypothetical protein